MMVQCQCGATQNLTMMLDTGYSLTMVRPELAEALSLQRAGRVTIVGISGQEEAAMYQGLDLKLGTVHYQPRRVAALPSDRGTRRRDGILGAGFFRRFVVELDGKVMRVYEPAAFEYKGSGEIIPIRFRQETPIIQGSLPIPGKAEVQVELEIDTGCDSGLCLGHDFAEEHHLLEAAGETSGSGRRGVGGGARVREGHLPELRLGKLKIERPPANFFQDNSPADGPMGGHIGMEILKKYKVTLDYSRKRMILEGLTPH
jgi:hypothetical protein